MTLGGYDRKYRSGYNKKKKYRTPYVPAETTAAAAAGVGIPGSIADVYGSSDPMQSLINGLGNSTAPSLSKPDYMWMGNEASGATEVGASGFDLTNNGFDQEQTRATLGSGNFCVGALNTTDRMLNTTDSEVQPGAGSYFALFVGDLGTIVGATRDVFGDRDITTPNEGWQFYTSGLAGQANYVIDDATEGADAVVLASSLVSNTLHVIGCEINRVDAEIVVHVDGSSAVVTTIPASAINNPNQTFGLGDTGINASIHPLAWGLFAVWKGTAAREITTTHISNLKTNLTP